MNKIKVKLLHSTPLWVASDATRNCYDSFDKSDKVETNICPLCYALQKATLPGEKDKALIRRVGIESGHGSVLEHLVYSFRIEGVSRALLQELARHRIASYSVKSTRYTLKELKDEKPFISYQFGDDFIQIARASKYIVLTDNDRVDEAATSALENLRALVADRGVKNDVAKYVLPEAYRTSIYMTINMRSLRNMLELRTSHRALPEFQRVAALLAVHLPDEHFYLVEDVIRKNADRSKFAKMALEINNAAQNTESKTKLNKKEKK
jgi:thymidylate synthase (FAD)